MSARVHSQAVYSAIKTSFRQLVKACGGLDAATAMSRVTRSTMQQYYSASDKDAYVFPPADVIADLEAECGQPIVTRKLAEVQGYDLTADQPASESEISSLVELAAKGTYRAADVLEAVMKAFSDGKVTDAELEECRKQTEAKLRNAERLYDTICRAQQARRECGRIDADITPLRKGAA